MRARKYLVAAAAGLALSGCTSFSSIHDVEAIRAAKAQGGTSFTRALTDEYRAQADEEVEEVEWNDAQWFARKGLQAARGEAVLPVDVAAAPNGAGVRPGKLGPVVQVRPEHLAELAAAHGRLVAFLDNGGREHQPQIAAHAQAVYDCWVEEEWEWEETEDITCRSDFLWTERQFTPVTAAATPPAPVASAIQRTYQVFFDWDRYDISEGAAAIIRHVAATARQANVTRIDLVGHTDSSGPAPYNQKLSERRADAVKAEFIQDGIAAGEVSSMGVGKAGQLVPTEDGVREPQNRRTEIILK
jgi:OOP family OmpA-OmpF porin